MTSRRHKDLDYEDDEDYIENNDDKEYLDENERSGRTSSRTFTRKSRTRKNRIPSSPPNGNTDDSIDENAPIMDEDEEDEALTDSTDSTLQKTGSRMKRPKKRNIGEIFGDEDEYDDDNNDFNGTNGGVSVKHEEGTGLTVSFKFLDKNHKTQFNELTSSPPGSKPTSDDEMVPAARRTRHKRVNYTEPKDYEEDEEPFDDKDAEIESTTNVDDEYSEGEEVIRKPDPSRMTARQRDKYYGKTSEKPLKVPEASLKNIKSKELLALMDEPQKKKNLSEEEIQLRRAEQARKRKNFSIKKLEAEKRDTLNKLLMKRASKVRDTKNLKGKEYGDEEESQAVPRRPQLKHNALFRWQSKTETKDGVRKNVQYYSIHSFS